MKAIFNPTSEQNYELEAQGAYNFVKYKGEIDRLIAEGRYEEACERRPVFLSVFAR